MQQGHKLRIHYIKNCGDVETNVITVQENSTITLTDDCQIIPNTCAETIGFKTAMVKFQVWRNNMPILKSSLDGCEMLSKVGSDIKAMIRLFGLPTKCPFEKVNQKIPIVLRRNNFNILKPDEEMRGRLEES